MRVWRYQGVHRIAWVAAVLLVLAVAIFVMAAGFSRLHIEPAPCGTGAEADQVVGVVADDPAPNCPSEADVRCSRLEPPLAF